MLLGVQLGASVRRQARIDHRGGGDVDEVPNARDRRGGDQVRGPAPVDRRRSRSDRAPGSRRPGGPPRRRRRSRRPASRARGCRPRTISAPVPSRRARSGSPGSTSARTRQPSRARRPTRRRPTSPAAPVTSTRRPSLTGSSSSRRRGQRGPVDGLEITDRELARGELPHDDRLAGQAILATRERVVQQPAGSRTRRRRSARCTSTSRPSARASCAPSPAPAPHPICSSAEHVGEAVAQQEHARRDRSARTARPSRPGPRGWCTVSGENSVCPSGKPQHVRHVAHARHGLRRPRARLRGRAGVARHAAPCRRANAASSPATFSIHSGVQWVSWRMKYGGSPGLQRGGRRIEDHAHRPTRSSREQARPVGVVRGWNAADVARATVQLAAAAGWPCRAPETAPAGCRGRARKRRERQDRRARVRRHRGVASAVAGLLAAPPARSRIQKRRPGRPP